MPVAHSARFRRAGDGRRAAQLMAAESDGRRDAVVLFSALDRVWLADHRARRFVRPDGRCDLDRGGCRALSAACARGVRALGSATAERFGLGGVPTDGESKLGRRILCSRLPRAGALGY
jgi:hypothetical protein